MGRHRRGHHCSGLACSSAGRRQRNDRPATVSCRNNAELVKLGQARDVCKIENLVGNDAALAEEIEALKRQLQE